MKVTSVHIFKFFSNLFRRFHILKHEQVLPEVLQLIHISNIGIPQYAHAQLSTEDFPEGLERKQCKIKLVLYFDVHLFNKLQHTTCPDQNGKELTASTAEGVTASTAAAAATGSLYFPNSKAWSPMSAKASPADITICTLTHTNKGGKYYWLSTSLCSNTHLQVKEY